MKKLTLFPMALLFVAHLVSAAELKTRLVNVATPEKSDKEVMVFAEAEGRVLWADANDEAMLSALRTAQKEGLYAALRFDDESGKIFGAELLEVGNLEEGYEAKSDKQSIYSPTVMNSLGDAQSLFDRQDGNTKRWSQCFNRAHGWSYDMWNMSGVNSMKVFIFFTQRYIKEYRYRWWFHVAPFVIVQTNSGPVEHVMDVSFSKGPIQMHLWTDMFMKNRAACPTVERYSQYRNNQWEQDCYLIQASMYYRTPKDLELLETQGRQELTWNLNEVREAREEAFRNHRDYNP
ncbi:MAG: hypothetical protein IPK04_10205 [Bdellovibrionales bacterium]|jgi:hypothetical protein|nr:hypothetical protein [Bdellovibrionales bacterium]